MGFGHFGVGQGVRGIGIDGLIKIADGFFEALRTQAIGEVFCPSKKLRGLPEGRPGRRRAVLVVAGVS